MSSKKPLTYRDAGVDIDAGESLIERIKPIASRTRRAGCLDSIGGFGGLFEIPPGKYCEPVLVSGTDGVGTKLKLAQQLNQHATIGIDLVAMCVNDIVVSGAEPLFFLDYFATGQLDNDTAAAVIEGIGRGCELAGAALIGGETAEMPGMYAPGEYDLAGFCVGVVEKSSIVDGSKIQAGDAVLGLASSGPHSNGYSLIRKIIERENPDLASPFAENTLGETLLAPTRIYVKSLLSLKEAITIKGLAHITGGGLLENLPRVLPQDRRAVIDAQSWTQPEVFGWLQQGGQVEQREMYRTFNCGIGMAVIVDKKEAFNAIQYLENLGETVFRIGEIEACDDGVRDDGGQIAFV